jgi:hypothetical protein
MVPPSREGNESEPIPLDNDWFHHSWIRFPFFHEKKIEHRQNPTNSSIIWWIVETAGWGVASIALITWAFYTIM